MSQEEDTKENDEKKASLDTVSCPTSSSKCRNVKTLSNTIPSDFRKLSNMRIIQKHLIYVIGLSSQLAFKENLLSKFEYFGQYGKIVKLVVNKNKTYNGNGPNGPSYSAYITYSSNEESSLAILSMDNAVIDNHVFRASYGTTKYCANFLRSVECLNNDCLYLHSIADNSEIVNRDEMNSNKSIFAEQHMLAMRIADIFNPEKKKIFLAMKNNKTVFPSPHLIYEKDIVLEYERSLTVNAISPKKKQNTLKSAITINSLYRQRQHSRFNFVYHSKGVDSPEIDVPDFISELLTQTFSRRSSLMKLKFKFSIDAEDFFYLNNENLRKMYSENNPWAMFIYTHALPKGSSEKPTLLSSSSSCMKKLGETEDFILLNQFNSY